MAKAKRNVKKASKSRKTASVARKPQKVSWLAKGYPVLSSVVVLDDCARAIDWFKKVLGRGFRRLRHWRSRLRNRLNMHVNVDSTNSEFRRTGLSAR